MRVYSERQRVAVDLITKSLQDAKDPKSLPINEAHRHALIEAMVIDGWACTSRKYRIVARLPKGMTGVECLLKYDDHPRNPDWALRLGEYSCKDLFLAHSKLKEAGGDEMEMTVDDFALFRLFGGCGLNKLFKGY